jgi:hypothetical protein
MPITSAKAISGILRQATLRLRRASRTPVPFAQELSAKSIIPKFVGSIRFIPEGGNSKKATYNKHGHRTALEAC